jgi:hypothetical protein
VTQSIDTAPNVLGALQLQQLTTNLVTTPVAPRKKKRDLILEPDVNCFSHAQIRHQPWLSFKPGCTTQKIDLRFKRTFKYMLDS